MASDQLKKAMVLASSYLEAEAKKKASEASKITAADLQKLTDEVNAAKNSADNSFNTLSDDDKALYNDFTKNKGDLNKSLADFVKFFDNTEDIHEQRIMLRGYLGKAYNYIDNKPYNENPERMRVYLSPDLNSYVEFDVLDLLNQLPLNGGLNGQGCVIWLRAKCPKKDSDGNEIKGQEMDIDLTYGGHGYELGQTKHYIDGDMLAGFNGNGGAAMTPNGCGTTPTPTCTCPGRCPGGGTGNCGGITPTQSCAGSRCQIVTMQCGAGGGDILPTGMLCSKYATVIGCDEWDFRKNYNPY